MFGYIVVNQAEMKYKEFEEYHKYYCGLCKILKERYGARGQLSLSYDMTFLVLLLTGLYEPENVIGKRRCVPHPFEKHGYITNQYSEYVADMNVILTYYKCLDDWTDEKKLAKKLYADLLLRKNREIRQLYEQKMQNISKHLQAIYTLEQEKSQDLDALAGHFGYVMAEICAMKDDIWKEDLSSLGYYLGRFIYILDAYDDLEKDIKKENFNPLISRLADVSHGGIIDMAENAEITEQQWTWMEKWVQEILTMEVAECAKAFERLPILENVEILRNILYSGIWGGFYRAAARRQKKDESKG